MLNRSLAALLIIGALGFVLIAVLQRSDEAAIKTAKEVDAFITQYCRERSALPTGSVLRNRFPDLQRTSGWFFYTDDKTYLKMQYPMKWWNKHAIGERRISEFTATVYAYIVEYKCGGMH